MHFITTCLVLGAFACFLSAQGRISTSAGTGVAGFSGDSGNAPQAQLSSPGAVAECYYPETFGLQGFSISGVYIADTLNHRIRRVKDGVITTIAGTGVAGFGGDHGPALAAQLNSPSGLAFSGDCKTLYISDSGNHRLRAIVLATSEISTIAGTGSAGFNGDGAAKSSKLNTPKRISWGTGGILIADSKNHRIRRVSGPYGAEVIETIAGTGTPGYSGDGGPAMSAELNEPQGVDWGSGGIAGDDGSFGGVYVADTGNRRIRRFSYFSGGGTTMQTVAGTGLPGVDGTLVGYETARFAAPVAVHYNSHYWLVPQLTVVDSAENRVRTIRFGVVRTVAGTGVAGYSGDSGLAEESRLNNPQDAWFYGDDRMDIADSGNHVIRYVPLCGDSGVLRPGEAIKFRGGGPLPCRQKRYALDLNAGDRIIATAIGTTGKSISLSGPEPSTASLGSTSQAAAGNTGVYLPSTGSLGVSATGRYWITFGSIGFQGNSSTFRVLRTGDPCSVAKYEQPADGYRPAAAFPNSGGMTTLNAIITPGCTFPVTLDQSWVQLQSSSIDGTTGAVTLSAPRNYGSARYANATIGTQLFDIYQEWACAYELSRKTVYIGADDAEISVTMTATSMFGGSCYWDVVPDPDSAAAVTPFPANGTGSGTLSLIVRPNFQNTSRSLNLSVGTETIQINQSGLSMTQRQHFIRLLYYSFLGRLPTAAELAFHDGSGVSRTNMTLNFLNSAEFNANGRFAAGLYLGLLDRDPELSGWRFQRAVVQKGIVSKENLITNFLNAAEYRLKWGTPDNAGFIRLLYRYVLGREATQAEVDFQSGALTAGVPRNALAGNFLNSPEFQINNNGRLLGNLLYFTLLLRDPTSQERENVMSNLNTGSPLGSTVDIFLNSIEMGNLFSR